MREEERDGIGQCADYLLHREGIETVVVYGIIGNSYIDGSLRTSRILLTQQMAERRFREK